MEKRKKASNIIPYKREFETTFQRTYNNRFNASGPRKRSYSTGGYDLERNLRINREHYHEPVPGWEFSQTVVHKPDASGLQKGTKLYSSDLKRVTHTVTKNIK